MTTLKNETRKLMTLAVGWLVALAATPCQAGPILDWLYGKNTTAPATGYACSPYGCGPVAPAAISPAPLAPRTAGYSPAWNAGYAPHYSAAFTPSYVAAPAPRYLAGYAPSLAPSYSVGYAPAYSPAYAPTYTAAYAPAYSVPYSPALVTMPVTGAAPAPAMPAQPTVVGYAPYQAAYSQQYEWASPVVAGYAPDPNYYTPAAAPAVVPSCGGPGCSGVRYVPQPAYRSTYYSAPVTTYRPVTSIDPVTGQVITVMRPCLGAECQLQRTATYYAPQPVAAPACGAAMCGAYPYAYAAPVAPYYAPSSGGVIQTTPIVPGGTAPVTTGPATIVTPGSGIPSVTSPAIIRQQPAGPGGEPANVQPSLNPGGASGGGAILPQSWQTPAARPDNLGPAVEQPVSTPAPAYDTKLQPVPDPEPPTGKGQAPQLINPKDKVTSAAPPSAETQIAARQARFTVSPVVWPSQRPWGGKTLPSLQPVAIPAADRDIDFSGWRSAR